MNFAQLTVGNQRERERGEESVRETGQVTCQQGGSGCDCDFIHN